MTAGVLFDIEGTLVGDKRYQPTAGARELVAELRRRGMPLGLITNNTTHRPGDILAQLAAGGLEFAAAELLTCTQAAAALLAARGAQRCLVIGTDDLAQLLTAAGLQVTRDEAVDAVVVGLDTHLSFDTLRRATAALLSHRALLVALHQNRLYRDDQGRVGPSAGAVVAALSYATQVEPLVVGKPSPDFFGLALARLGLEATEVLVVSDDPFSDLGGAKRLGMQTAFVLVGAYPEARVLTELPAAEQPDIVAADLRELHRSWSWGP